MNNVTLSVQELIEAVTFISVVLGAFIKLNSRLARIETILGADGKLAALEKRVDRLEEA